MRHKFPAWINDPHQEFKIVAVLGVSKNPEYGYIENEMVKFKGLYDDAIAQMKALRDKDKIGFTQWELRRKITKEKYKTEYITRP